MAVILKDGNFNFAGDAIGNIDDNSNLLTSNLILKKDNAFMPINTQTSTGATRGVENSGSVASAISADTGYAVIDVSNYKGMKLLISLQGGSIMLGCGFSPTTKPKDINYSVSGNMSKGRGTMELQEVQVPSDAMYMYLTYYVSRYDEYEVSL